MQTEDIIVILAFIGGGALILAAYAIFGPRFTRVDVNQTVMRFQGQNKHMLSSASKGGTMWYWRWNVLHRVNTHRLIVSVPVDLTSGEGGDSRGARLMVDCELHSPAGFVGIADDLHEGWQRRLSEWVVTTTFQLATPVSWDELMTPEGLSALELGIHREVNGVSFPGNRYAIAISGMVDVSTKIRGSQARHLTRQRYMASLRRTNASTVGEDSSQGEVEQAQE